MQKQHLHSMQNFLSHLDGDYVSKEQKEMISLKIFFAYNEPGITHQYCYVTSSVISHLIDGIPFGASSYSTWKKIIGNELLVISPVKYV